jgi:hypothetical protein
MRRQRCNVAQVFTARETRCAAPGNATKGGSGNETSTCRVVVVEQAADHLPTGVQPVNWTPIGAYHSSAGIDSQSAKGEGDAASAGVGMLGRRIKRRRPVGLLWTQTLGG